MAVLTGKLGQWTLPHVHMWKDRESHLLAPDTPLIKSDSKIATIGSCFASELASAMSRLTLDGAMHPAGLFYNTKSIRQEFERIFESWDAGVSPWQTQAGFIHPLKSYRKTYDTSDALMKWSEDIDAQADTLFKSPDLIVITLGLIEAWRMPDSQLYLPQIPHPDIFESSGAEFCRLSVQDMFEDLEVVRACIKKYTQAELILTVSPIPLHSTFTDKDVRVANTESKSRIRAAVSQFIDAYPDVHYFHSYEIVTTAERLSDFMLEDGRHVHRHAVDYILEQFLTAFAEPSLKPTQSNPSWLSEPAKTSARPEAGRARKILSKARTLLPEGVDSKLQQIRKVTGGLADK